jgi:hypothetical protein
MSRGLGGTTGSGLSVGRSVGKGRHATGGSRAHLRIPLGVERLPATDGPGELSMAGQVQEYFGTCNKEITCA